MVAGLLQRDDLGRLGFAGDGKAQGDVPAALEMHREEDARLHVHDEIARARVVHAALARIDREKRHVDFALGDGRDAVVEQALGGLNLLDGTFVAPVPQVQIARVENLYARAGHKEGYALVRGAEGLDGDGTEALRLARVHAHAAVRLGQVKADDIHGGFAAQAVNALGEVIVVAVADKNVQLSESGKRLLVRQDTKIGTDLARVKQKADVAERDEKTAASQIGYCDVFHGLLHSFPADESSRLISPF